MGYNNALQSLMGLTGQAFSEIPECLIEVITEKDIIKIASREQSWLYELCKSISPAKEQCDQLKRPWPKYIPKKAMKRGGEAFLLTAWDMWRQQVVMLKIPLPQFSLQKSQHVARPPQQGQKSSLIQGARALLAIGKDLCAPKRRLEPPQKKTEEHPKFDENRDITRFRRSFILQKQLHQIARRSGGDLGYIPDTFEFGEPPACYYSMEFIEKGEDFLEYIKSHSDEQNLLLFLRIVNFIEKVLHGYGVAHCDIATRNILVRDDMPILLDFGIAKATSLPEITVDNSQLGSILMASASQLEDSKNRGFQDDIFSLGRLFWILVNKRIPSLEGIVAREGESGKIEYDASAVASLFDKYLVPERFQEIFIGSQTSLYEDISNFRVALEGVIYLEPQPVVCQEKCQWIIELETKLIELGKILAQAGLKDKSRETTRKEFTRIFLKEDEPKAEG